MNNKYKIIKATIGLLLVLFITICISYAFWTLTLSQSDKNKVSSACLKLNLSEKSTAISLQNSFPISDFEGMQTEGYTFTVQNNCNRDIDYRIDLDSLVLDDEDNRLPSSSVDVLLDYGSNFIENNEIPTYADLISVETTDSTLKDKKTLAYDTVLAGETNTHILRMWIDENAKIDDELKDFETKISITSGQGIEKEYTDESCFTFNSSTGAITAYDVSTCGTDVVIPNKIGGVNVISTDGSSFSNKSLTSIEFPRNMRSVSGFYGNSTLKKLIFKDGVHTIKSLAFSNNSADENIYNLILPKTMKIIQYNAFYGLGLQRLIIPDNVTRIEEGAFSSNKIKELLIGSGITSIAKETFYKNNIENLVIPNTTTAIYDRAFNYNPLKSITLGSGLKSLGLDVFYAGSNDSYIGTIPEEIYIPANVTKINGSFKSIPSTTKIYFDNCQENLTIGTYGNTGGTQIFTRTDCTSE